MVIFKDDFNMKKAEAIQYKSFELLEVTTTVSNQLMRFLTIYRPPPSQKNKLTFTMFKDEFQNFAMEKSLCNGNLILIGDFNIHVENENDSQGKWLMELFDSLNLE
ncbi:ATP-dependent DNA helicase [Elysia marginata]|uniref:ATP-dependent DNA helicase n=1 Tax=Elysia marginata TaxID=1093978 RepID=A0AAV4GHV1_9GAST|nr:ATP-dependent DNA helicase [Elysia marginata]